MPLPIKKVVSTGPVQKPIPPPPTPPTNISSSHAIQNIYLLRILLALFPPFCLHFSDFQFTLITPFYFLVPSFFSSSETALLLLCFCPFEIYFFLLSFLFFRFLSNFNHFFSYLFSYCIFPPRHNGRYCSSPPREGGGAYPTYVSLSINSLVMSCM